METDRRGGLRRRVGYAFLAQAKEIVVLTVEEEDGRGEDADRLVRALVWHGFPVTAERLISGPPGAVETLLEAARTKAGLLIMGGYGHSRLREWMLGGFTESILAAAPLPVLIADWARLASTAAIRTTAEIG